MRVRLKSIYAGPRGAYAAGQVADLPTAEAYALCEGGFAEQIEDAVETTDVPTPETAEAPANRRRRKARQ